jgi:thioredoxin-like negative regulator of GroEL
MSAPSSLPPPRALLLIAPGCPHCAALLQALSELVKEAIIARLEVVNLAADPDAGRAYGVRSVPWLRLGEFELTGALSKGQLRDWVERIGSSQGWMAYFKERLAGGDRHGVDALIRTEPLRINALVQLLSDPALSVDVRVGIGAVFEELSGTDIAAGAVHGLAGLTGHAHATVRADAVHLLGLTKSPEAVAVVRARLQDEDPQVREIAEEALETLREQLGPAPPA